MGGRGGKTPPVVLWKTTILESALRGTITYPPGSLTFSPLKIYRDPKGSVVFLPSVFKGELFNFGGVSF